jgi:hypothetical protein
MCHPVDKPEGVVKAQKTRDCGEQLKRAMGLETRE